MNNSEIKADCEKLIEAAKKDNFLKLIIEKQLFIDETNNTIQLYKETLGKQEEELGKFINDGLDNYFKNNYHEASYKKLFDKDELSRPERVIVLQFPMKESQML